LSYQTLEGFQITAKSIVACVKYMLNCQVFPEAPETACDPITLK